MKRNKIKIKVKKEDQNFIDLMHSSNTINIKDVLQVNKKSTPKTYYLDIERENIKNSNILYNFVSNSFVVFINKTKFLFNKIRADSRLQKKTNEIGNEN